MYVCSGGSSCMIDESELRNEHMSTSTELAATVSSSAFVEELFDRIADIVYFVKDTDGCYVAVNQTLVERCGLLAKRELIGRTAREVFPEPLGTSYLDQDLAVCSSGTPVSDLLELHLYPTRGEGWCLTDKAPVRSVDGSVIGLVGVSRDLRLPGAADGELHELAHSVVHIQTHFAESLRVDELAEMAGMSSYQFNRRIRAVFQLTTSQLIAKTRIDAATHLLRTSSLSVAEIALECGYCDQSAFTRQFRATVGLPPGQYRERHSG